MVDEKRAEEIVTTLMETVDIQDEEDLKDHFKKAYGAGWQDCWEEIRKVIRIDKNRLVKE
jgi:hypothetical protein